MGTFDQFLDSDQSWDEFQGPSAPPGDSFDAFLDSDKSWNDFQTTKPDEPLYDEMGLPVGEPELAEKAMALPFVPVHETLRAPGPVTEAELADAPEMLEIKESSILQMVDSAASGLAEKAFPGGFTAEDAGGALDLDPKLAGQVAQVATDLGVGFLYAGGVIKLFGGIAGELMQQWRMLSIPERRLMIQAVEGMQEAGMSEGQILKSLRKQGRTAEFEKFKTEALYKRAGIDPTGKAFGRPVPEPPIEAAAPGVDISTVEPSPTLLKRAEGFLGRAGAKIEGITSPPIDEIRTKFEAGEISTEDLDAIKEIWSDEPGTVSAIDEILKPKEEAVKPKKEPVLTKEEIDELVKPVEPIAEPAPEPTTPQAEIAEMERRKQEIADLPEPKITFESPKYDKAESWGTTGARTLEGFVLYENVIKDKGLDVEKVARHEYLHWVSEKGSTNAKKILKTFMAKIDTLMKSQAEIELANQFEEIDTYVKHGDMTRDQGDARKTNLIKREVDATYSSVATGPALGPEEVLARIVANDFTDLKKIGLDTEFKNIRKEIFSDIPGLAKPLTKPAKPTPAEAVEPTIKGEGKVDVAPKALYRGSVKDGGEWFTTDKEAAREYAGLDEGGKVSKVEVDLIGKKIAEPTDIIGVAKKLGIDTEEESLYSLVSVEFEDVVAELKKQGFDGVHLPKGEDFAPSGKEIESYRIFEKEKPTTSPEVTGVVPEGEGVAPTKKIGADDLNLYADKVKLKGGIISVKQIGSTVGGKGKDVDILYEFEDKKLSEDAEGEIIELIEGSEIDAEKYDTFVKVGDRYFHVSTGAGRGIVENTDYAKEQKGKPFTELGTVVEPEAVEKAVSKAKKPVKAKVDKTRTLRGAIKKIGGINFLNYKGELKELPTSVKYLSKKTGVPIDDAVQNLKDDGWLDKDVTVQSFLEDLRTKPDILKRDRIARDVSEKKEYEKSEREKQIEKEMEREPEEPPKGTYVQLRAEDLPLGKKLTIIEGKTREGWDVYEVAEKDPFGVTLINGETIELSRGDNIEVLKSELPTEKGVETIDPDGTYVDWSKTKTSEKQGLKATYYGTYRKDGAFKSWKNKTEIDRIKAAKGKPILTLKQDVAGAKPGTEGEKGKQKGLGLTVEDKAQPGLFPPKPKPKGVAAKIISEKGEVDISAAVEKIAKRKAEKKAKTEAIEKKRAFLEKHFPEKLKKTDETGAEEYKTNTDAAREVLNKHFTDFMYWVVDKNRSISSVQKKLDTMTEDIDLFLKETQRPKITASKVKSFWDDSVAPLIKEIVRTKKSIPELEEYAHAKHAHEANRTLRLANSKRYLDSLVDSLPKKESLELRKKIEAEESPIKPAKPKEYHRLLNEAFTVFSENKKVKKLKSRWDAFSEKPSGMSDADADIVLESYKNDKEIEQLRLRLSAINNEKLEILYEAGLIPEGEYKAIVKKYENYTPLYREGYEDAVSGTGKGLMPAGRPIKTRGGSIRNVVNIVANTISNYENAIDRAEKAASSRVLLSLIKENPQPDIWSIKPEKQVPRHDSQGNLRMYPDISNVGENEIRIMVDGKQYLIEVDRFNQDAMLMLRTLKSQDKSAGPIVNTLSKVNRWLARINTSWSPEFILSNLVRDAQTAGINIHDTGIESKRIFRGAMSGIKAIYNVERGKKTTGEYEQLYKRFKASGGKIGWADVHGSIENLANKITKELEMQEGKRPVRKTVTDWLQWIEDANTSVENGVRLHVFKLATESGKSDIKAAQIASDITVDFTKKGAAGPVINSLYLFANAGIQGSYRLMRAMGTSPKVRKIAAGIVGFGFLLGLLNSWAGGEDEDGEDYYNKIEDFIRERNAIIMLPGTKGKYAKIPLPWGYNFVFNTGTELSRMFTKEDYEPLNSAMRLASTFANSFNPVASGTLLQTLSPTVVDPFAMVAENKNWFGGDLMPEKNIFEKVPTPDSQRYWKSARKPSVWITSQLSELTGGSTVRKGAIDISPETLDLIVDTTGGSMLRFWTDSFKIPSKIISKEEVKMYEIPFLRRVAGEQSEWTDSRIYHDNARKVLTAREELKVYKGTSKYWILKKKLSSVIGLIDAAEKAEKEVKKLRKTKRKYQASENKKKVDLYDQKINKIYKKFNAKYNKSQSGKKKEGLTRPPSTTTKYTKKPLTLKEAYQIK